MLGPLKEGYYDAVAEVWFSGQPVTDCKIPVFCRIDDFVSCNYVRGFSGTISRGCMRDAHQDSPARTRHLLRLWLSIGNDRPIVDAILRRAEIHARVHRERSGRIPLRMQAGA